MTNNNTDEESYLLVVRKFASSEHIATIRGKNAKQRALQYAKELVLPDRQTAEVIAESEYWPGQCMHCGKYCCCLF